MHITNLRKVGGSVMLAVPPVLLDILHLQPGATVGIEVESGRLVVEPQQRPRYTWTNCSPNATQMRVVRECSKRASKQEQEWIESKPVGGELI